MTRISAGVPAMTDDWLEARRRLIERRRIQNGYLIRRPSHVRCLHGQRIPLSYYSPDSSGWRPDRPSPRDWKEDEAKCSRKERRDRKRALGHHMRNTWLAENQYSLEWTTCGCWVLGPPKGTWAQYPRSKTMKQRDARAAKRHVLTRKST